MLKRGLLARGWLAWCFLRLVTVSRHVAGCMEVLELATNHTGASDADEMALTDPS
jgi:hypothetical protein